MADSPLIKMLLVHCSLFWQCRYTVIQPLPGNFVLICFYSLFHPNMPITFNSCLVLYSLGFHFSCVDCALLWWCYVRQLCLKKANVFFFFGSFSFFSCYICFCFFLHFAHAKQLSIWEQFICSSVLLESIQHVWSFIVFRYSSRCLLD